MPGARFGEVAAAAALTRFFDDRVEAGQPGDLLGAAEAARLADLGEQVAGEDRPDPVDRLQRLAALIVAGEATQLGVDRLELRLQRRHHRQERVDLQAGVLRELERGSPAQPRWPEQVRPRAGPTLVQKVGVQALTPAAPVLGERLAQPRAIAQLLDLLGRDPRLRQHLLREQACKPARIEPIGLRAPASAEQGSRLHRLRQAHLEPALDEFAPNPTPTGRRLNRHRLDPTSPLLGPTGEALAISREPLLDQLAARGRARPPGTHACGCRSLRTRSRTSSLTDTEARSA